jgi:hypothetical protein
MPRVRINLHDIDAIEELEEQEDWEELIGLHDADQQREIQRYSGAQERRRQHGRPRELRFGGAEALERRRAERRKQIARSRRN